MLQLKILCTTTKVQHSQINKNNFFRKRNISSPVNSLNPCNCKSQKKKGKKGKHSLTSEAQVESSLLGCCSVALRRDYEMSLNQTRRAKE